MKKNYKTTKQTLVSTRQIVVDKEVKAIDGWTIDKGTTLHVVNDTLPVHPTEGHRLLVCRVDNGTGHLYLMPEAVVREKEGKLI